MVDLSQKKPLKPNIDSSSNPSVSSEPPATQQPTEPFRAKSLKADLPEEKPKTQQDKTPFSSIKDEEKIISPEQEEIKKELSELGISPQGGSKKTRVILATLGVFLLIATLPAAVYLVKQRQEIRKEAYVGQSCVNDTDCSGYPNEKCTGRVCVAITPADEICDDDVDNDGDGQVDCDDPECASTPACQAGFCSGCGKEDGYVSGLPGPSDCNGTWCHTSSRNYCCWDEDGGGCDLCATGPGPGIDCSGNCISLSGLSPGTVVKFCRFYADHDVSCPYSTGSLDCFNVTVPSSGSITRCIPDGKCGQLEADGYCGVCKDTGCGGPGPEPPEESPPPPPPPDTALCEFCKVFDEDWNEITDFSTITVNQTIYLATRGATGNPKGITKARFRINGGDWIETTSKHGNRFYIQYIIPEANTYTIQSMVFNPDLGWY